MKEKNFSIKGGETDIVMPLVRADSSVKGFCHGAANLMPYSSHLFLCSVGVLKQMLVRCVMEIHGEGCCEALFPLDSKLRWKI